MAADYDPQFEHENWSSEAVFLLATIGGAVGLGNLWRFPYLVGENGGGAFVLIYIGFVVLLCLPLVLTELALGRRGKGSAITTIRKLAAESNASSGWHIIGWLSILIPLVALSYYAVIAGWSVDYIEKAALGKLQGITAEESTAAFGAMTESPMRVLVLHALFIAGAIFVVARGLGKGIEVIMRVMMPGLFLLLVGLAIYSVLQADIGSALNFLFNADFSKITGKVVVLALGQAFFSVTVGAGLLITYGAYLPAEISLGKASVIIVIADTAVALLAGIVIFPIVFSSGLDPAGGPGLIFQTLPVAFGSMSGGYVVGLLFFIMLFFAAFSTAIAMLEPPVSWLEEHRGFSRLKVTFGAGVFAWFIGLGSALSFNVLSDARPFSGIPLMADMTIFGAVDFVVGSLLMPLNAAIMCLFAGWAMSGSVLFDEMGVSNPKVVAYVRFILKFVAPVLVGCIFINSFV